MKKILLLSLLISWHLAAQNLDVRLLKDIYGTNQPTHIHTAKLLSSTATPVGLALPAGLLVIGLATNNKKLKQQGWQSLGGFIIASTTTQITKRIVSRERPFIAHPMLFSSRIEGEEPNHSFPSGHTTTAFATATTLAINYRKWYVAVPAYAWAGAIAYSRMRLGVHYPSDVLAGTATGAAGAWLSYKIQKKWLQKKR